MRRIDFIINPISGTKSKEELALDIEQVFPADRFDVRLHITAHPGQAKDIVHEAAYFNSDTIVAVGGDGTVNEVACAVIDARRPNLKLGVVPMGSGNGLARHAEIPTDINESLTVIRDGHSELIDYGDINGHRFFTTCGTGFDAEVGYRFSQMNMRGPISYGRAIIEMGAIYKPRQYRIFTDKEVFNDTFFMIVVGNAAQWGNNFYVTPNASQQDGLFSVSIVKPFLIIEAPIVTYQLMNKMFDHNVHVQTIETRKLRIESDNIGYSHIDGEPIKLDAPLEITMHPSGLRIICPLVRNNKL